MKVKGQWELVVNHISLSLNSASSVLNSSLQTQILSATTAAGSVLVSVRPAMLSGATWLYLTEEHLSTGRSPYYCYTSCLTKVLRRARLTMLPKVYEAQFDLT